ncbi:MAG: hypothetical protein K2Z80_04405 [Xanthobacteraceae bacterium]|nr:hypothetical protein [Xanthobacteraceae bacterium]
MFGKTKRLALVLAALACAVPAQAEQLGAEQARTFVAGKHFAYTCFDGTNGSGRIYADGSVAGYIQPGGSGPRRFVVLPANTLQIKGDRYCAALRGLPFEPCFNVNRTSQVSFRGAVSGLGFAYCDFYRRSTRADLVRPARRDVRADAVQRD